MDYKATVFLPQTDFPMKAGLPKREPEILKLWDEIGLYARQRAVAKGKEKFILHDGPPYANGHLHIGHALNKILKDVINRTQQMLGKDANYVPGWDCHGLPIEWKIEEKYRAAGKNKDEVPILKFRQECREFAEHWIKVQREEFKRLGVVGDWDNPYSTMDHAAEAQIAREVGKFLTDGSLYKGAKPVLWSVVEKTALAEAEIEYHDFTSTTIWVRFPIMKPSRPELAGASVVIWTTTPWTIPGNRAIAYGSDFEYVVVEVTRTPDSRLLPITIDNLTPQERETAETFANASAASVESYAAAVSRQIEEARRNIFFKGKGTFVIAATRKNDFLNFFSHQTISFQAAEIDRVSGADLAGTICHHPLRGHGYEFDVPLYPAHFVETETGTGFVHIAPGHGADDWELGMKHGLPVPETVGPEGVFYDHVPLFAGKVVIDARGRPGNANAAVVAALQESGALLAQGKLVHQYPHSWRSKAPLIFRNTAQWFISMEKTGLRATALAAIDATRFVPAAGRARLRGMIETRPDWCVSRQRAWGVPIAAFVHKKTGEPLRDPKVLGRIVAAFEKEGADAWFSSDPSRFLGNDHAPDDFEQVTDILDVWFESGATHSFVLEVRSDLKWPASLYLEGSDQHRGWFHSSLLESCGTRGRAPYDAVLTHGFVMAEDGQKMSKSLGNVVSPQEVVDQHGADILRLWVVGSDYSEDLRIGPEIIKQTADIYRRLRNTLRYLLGSLHGFQAGERVALEAMPELERWVLHRLWQLDGKLRQACANLDFHPFFAELHNFCASDLSAFYFDIRKDSLYCDRADAPTRRAARTILDLLFDCLTAWLAPFACFTAEEAWRTRYPGPHESVHLRLFPAIPAAWRNDGLGERWAMIRDIRRVVTGKLELARAAKTMGSSLQAAPVIFADSRYDSVLKTVDWAEVCITSAVKVKDFKDHFPHPDTFQLADVPGVVVGFERAEGTKCERCWKVLPDVGRHAEHRTLCGRCVDAVHHQAASAA